MANPDTVYLLDASVYLFRAWFALPDSIRDRQGRPVNGVLGYWRLLLEQLARVQPRWMLAGFDESLFSGFRHQLYLPYKANRVLPDPEMAYQLALCRLLTETLGISCRSSPVYEADDVLATAGAVARQQGLSLTLLTRDKDLAQLVQPGDCWWDWGGGMPQDHASLTTRWQVDPMQIPDVLALAGDAVDNIPGVKGIGLQTATALIHQFGNLEHLYRHLEQGLPLALRGAARLTQALQSHCSEAFLFRELIRLHVVDEGVPITVADLQRRTPDADDVRALLASLELGSAFLGPFERYVDATISLSKEKR